MFRRLVLASVAVAAAVSALPAQAAPSTQKLFFANVSEGAATGCVQNYQLVRKQVDGNECSGTIAAANGSGLFSNDTYGSEKKFAGLKVDQSRKITGEIFIQHFPIIGLSSGPRVSLPGYVDLDITVKFDKVTVGKITITGVVLPADGLKHMVSLAIPAAFKNKKISKVSAAVTWRTAVGLSGISYTAPAVSFLAIPSK